MDASDLLFRCCGTHTHTHTRIKLTACSMPSPMHLAKSSFTDAVHHFKVLERGGACGKHVSECGQHLFLRIRKKKFFCSIEHCASGANNMGLVVTVLSNTVDFSWRLFAKKWRQNRRLPTRYWQQKKMILRKRYLLTLIPKKKSQWIRWRDYKSPIGISTIWWGEVELFSLWYSCLFWRLSCFGLRARLGFLFAPLNKTDDVTVVVVVMAWQCCCFCVKQDICTTGFTIYNPDARDRVMPGGTSQTMTWLQNWAGPKGKSSSES